MTQFAEQLKYFHSQKGLSQEWLAEQLHLLCQVISRWETGETAPDLDTLVKLVSILEVTLDELVIGVRPEPVIVEKVVEKVEKSMNMCQYLHEESKRPLTLGYIIIIVSIIILGVYFIFGYFH